MTETCQHCLRDCDQLWMHEPGRCFDCYLKDAFGVSTAVKREPPPMHGCTYKLGRSCVYCLRPIADDALEPDSMEFDTHWRCLRNAIRGEVL